MSKQATRLLAPATYGADRFEVRAECADGVTRRHAIFDDLASARRYVRLWRADQAKGGDEVKLCLAEFADTRFSDFEQPDGLRSVYAEICRQKRAARVALGWTSLVESES